RAPSWSRAPMSAKILGNTLIARPRCTSGPADPNAGHLTPTTKERPMPAAAADTLTLPRVLRPRSPRDSWRRVSRVVAARRQLEGDGFVVRRPFPGVSLSEADPF